MVPRKGSEPAQNGDCRAADDDVKLKDPKASRPHGPCWMLHGHPVLFALLALE